MYEVVCILITLLHSDRTALQNFEALLALTNLSSVSESVRLGCVNVHLQHFCFSYCRFPCLILCVSIPLIMGSTLRACCFRIHRNVGSHVGERSVVFSLPVSVCQLTVWVSVYLSTPLTLCAGRHVGEVTLRYVLCARCRVLAFK